jgi:hypothetical protein
MPIFEIPKVKVSPLGVLSQAEREAKLFDTSHFDPAIVQRAKKDFGDTGKLSDAEYQEALAERANQYRIESILGRLGFNTSGYSNLSGSSYHNKKIGTEYDPKYGWLEHDTHQVRLANHPDYHPPMDDEVKQRFNINHAIKPSTWEDYHISPNMTDEQVHKILSGLDIPSEPDITKAQGGIVDSAPEEAIKNTITDPQAFKMLDMDLANLALMNQPRRMAGGGAVNMDEGGFLNSVYRNVVPAHLRTFGETLMGDRTPITEKNFTPSELDQMRNAIMTSRKDREITNARVFDNDVKKAFKSGASDKELMAIMQKGPSQKIDQSVGYQHYPGGDIEVRRDTDFGHDASIRSTLGRFAYSKDANGNLIATDNYKFTNDLPRETRPTSDYAGMNTPEKLWTLAKDTAQMGGLETLPSRVGNAFIGADGRPVNVNLGAAPFAYGGAVHKAEGGIIDGHPIFQTAQVPFAEYRHGIGMAEGGQPTQDQMRYELTNPHGTDYDRFVPQTNAFSVNEKPASLAYTQLDVPQVSETGGVAPLPRTVHDDRIAEIDKQLDRGVKPDWMSSKDFLQDQAERKGYNTTDTSLSAMGQNVLAALGNSHIFGGAFRALGAPYEAAEKVLGSSMGLDPMTGIIGKTGELHSIPKAGQYAASRVAPFASKVDDMVRELHASGAMPQPGMSIKDVTPKVLAPANEQGFYSPTEAAALNLQRKSGNGQAFLNDLMKGENVRSEEISGMGLDTFLKDKKNVTAAEVQDFIAQNKLGLGEARYGALTKDISESRDAFKAYSQELASKYDLNPNENISMYARLKNIPAEEIEKYERLQNEWLDQQPKTAKFSGYQLPGGENYREVVLTLPTKVDQRGFFIDRDGDKFYLRNHDGKTLGEYGSRYEAQEAMHKNTSQDYKSSHFDEPNILAHLRMSDRVTDGKKTLLVDEVQSDWHQAGRERGYVSDDDKISAQLENELKLIKTKRSQLSQEAANLPKAEVEKFNLMQEEYDRLGGQEDNLRQRLNDLFSKPSAVPDAPYKDDWYQLALRRAVKEAIDGGYDRVALPTGARVAERFDLSKHVDRIDYNKNPDGTFNMSAIKDGQEVFSKEGLDEKELSGIIGKDVAKKIVGDEGHAPTFKADRWEAEDGDVPEFKSLSGLDLQVGGEGMKKYYDEIYPGYLKKFGKKYGASIGKTTVDVEGAAEPLHYMDITPAMRKEFSTGIHMKKGGKVSFANSLDAMRHELTKAK